MAEIDSLQIEIQASADSASKALDSLINRFDNVSKKLSNVGSSSDKNIGGITRNVTRAKKSFGGLASAIGKFYATYFLLIRAMKGISGAIEDTADYIEAFNYFTVSMGKIASKWDSDWENYGEENARNYSNKFFTTLNSTFKKMSGVSFDPKTGLLSETGLKNLGLNLQEVTQYAAQLASMMDSVGQSGETTLATTNAFVKLAGDISSLFNIDYSDAAGKIRSVLQGQSRAGYAFGWDTTMASLQAMADKLNLSKAVSEMSQMEKQQLRILTIFEQSRVAWGDQANTINTLANQFRLLKNNTAETGMMLGQLFLPILAKLTPIINGLIIAIKRLLGNMAILMGIEIKDIGQGFTDTEEDFENITDEIEKATNAAKEYKNQLMGFDEINKISDNGTVTSTDTSAVDLTKQIIQATEEYEKVYNDAYNNMKNKASKWADLIEPMLKPLEDVAKYVASGEFLKAGSEVSGIGVKILDIIIKSIKETDWSVMGSSLGQFVTGAIGTSFQTLGQLGTIITEGSVAIGNLVSSFLDAVDWETLTEQLLEGLTALFTNLDWSKIFKAAGNVISSTTGVILEILGAIIKNIPTRLFDFVSAAVLNLTNFVVSSTVESIYLAVDLIVQAIGKVVELIAEAWSVRDEWGQIGINLLLGIIKGITDNLAVVFDGISDFFNKVVKSICDVFGIHSPAKKMETYGKNILLGVLQGFTNAFSSISKPITEFYDKIKGYFDKDDWNFGGIKDGLKTAFDNAISAIKKVWNTFADGLNAKLTFKIDPIKVLGKTIFAGTTLDLGNIPKFATGGFPEDGLFMANHGELVGQFSNGRTAVANNEQIIAGIEGGVERAVARVLAPYLADIAESSRITSQKEFGISERALFRSTQRQARNYTTQTGLPAF